MILGAFYSVGDKIWIRYGNGTQHVTIAEVTRTGRVKISRWPGQVTKAPLSVSDERWIGRVK